MSLPFLSVVVPTMRVGGLDVLTHGLRGQVFRDFELVLVDALRDLRGHALDEEEYQVTHVAPVDNPFPLNAFCRYANTGLLHARGEIVVFVTDYTYLPPDCLQRHAQFHASHDFVEALMCPHQYLGLPPLRSSFPTYKQSEVERYALDVEAGKLDDCMWTIFQKEFSRADADSLPLDAIYGWADPKMKMGSGPIDPTFFHAKNESVRREHVNAIDGWDEQLDHAHCYQDSDLADRLSTLRGVRWILDQTNVAYIVNPRTVFCFPKRERNESDNERIWHERKAAGYPGRVDSILREGSD
jgi:hypothetical protein